MPMRISIRAMTGRKLSLDAEASDTVRFVKIRIQEMWCISRNQQQLIYGVQQLKDDSSLSECNIHAECTLQLVVIEEPRRCNVLRDITNVPVYAPADPWEIKEMRKHALSNQDARDKENLDHWEIKEMRHQEMRTLRIAAAAAAGGA
mmetsp:Transcript_108676/g.232170  ORF Transcript_108676/g.232170 Transcript_108676/m.232170 type:complete len:147 (+) Transcript_108676:56-496(+)